MSSWQNYHGKILASRNLIRIMKFANRRSSEGPLREKRRFHEAKNGQC